jgi:hypothetical protein
MERQQEAWRWMQRLTQGLSAGTLAVTVVMALPATAPEAGAPTQWEHAMADYQAGRWSAAYGTLAVLADAGNPDAARLAAMMVRQGPLLFGQRFTASTERQAAWARLTGGAMPSVAPATESRALVAERS